MPGRSRWDAQAENWIAWARTSGHDVFEYFSPAFFEDIVPRHAARTLEIGCGEGRVSRALASRGHSVIALDISPTLARAARAADHRRSSYIAADATALPFAGASFELVVAYNSLQTFTAAGDMARAVREAARVLRPSGTLCLCVAHPMTDVALVNKSGADDLTLAGSYFDQQRVDDTVTSDGLTVNLTGWTYTLQDYAHALEDAGFAIEALREPRPTETQVAERPSLGRWRRIPLFLMIRAVKR